MCSLEWAYTRVLLTSDLGTLTNLSSLVPWREFSLWSLLRDKRVLSLLNDLSIYSLPKDFRLLKTYRILGTPRILAFHTIYIIFYILYYIINLYYIFLYILYAKLLISWSLIRTFKYSSHKKIHAQPIRHQGDWHAHFTTHPRGLSRLKFYICGGSPKEEVLALFCEN